jgi:hypothetical protein
MYEFLGWLSLSESPSEADEGGLADAIREINDLLVSTDWPNVSIDHVVLNGQHYVKIAGLVNRMRDEADWLSRVIDTVRTRLPGSWGLLYERDDEKILPPGENGFRVTVIARGNRNIRLDPFFSPCRPTIED